MKSMSSLTLIGILSAVSMSCKSTTVINSTPSGAALTINGNNVGTTPYKYSDTKLLFTKQQISLEMKGYERFDGFIQRDEVVPAYLAIGILCFLPTILWAWEYPPNYTFPLKAENQKAYTQGLGLGIKMAFNKDYPVPFKGSTSAEPTFLKSSTF